MANTEQSFADRLQRGRQLQSAIAGFTPAFDPADGNLEPTTFGSFLESLDVLNQAVSTTEADWKTTAAQRIALVEDIKTRALRASARVKSNSAWKAHMPAVKAAADALRGYRAAAPKPPPDAPAAISPARRPAKTDQSYGDIKLLLDKLIAALQRISGYDTGAPVDISIPTLSSLSTQFNGLNQMVAGKEQALAAARTPRRMGYDEDTASNPCLRTRMKAIKEATKAQYGTGSTQFSEIKGIKV